MVIETGATITSGHLEDAKKIAYDLLDFLDVSLTYHNKEHTTELVFPWSIALAAGEEFSPEERYLTGIAAVFHDTGFPFQYNKNEPLGAEFAEEYMLMVNGFFYDPKHIQTVKEAILNTNMKNPPPTKVAAVLRDADLSYIGGDNFMDRLLALQEESQLHPKSPFHEVSLEDKLWGESSLAFIEGHRWFTHSARLLFGNTKKRNLRTLKQHYGL